MYKRNDQTSLFVGERQSAETLRLHALYLHVRLWACACSGFYPPASGFETRGGSVGWKRVCLSETAAPSSMCRCKSTTFAPICRSASPADLGDTERGPMNTAWWSFYYSASWSVNKIQATGHVYWGQIRGKWQGIGWITLSPRLLLSLLCHSNSYGDTRPWGGQGQLEN